MSRGRRPSIVIAAGSTEGVISIKIKDDGHREGSETFKLKLTSFDRGDFAPSGHDLQATATIIDDDGRGSAAFWHGDTLLDRGSLAGWVSAARGWP